LGTGFPGPSLLKGAKKTKRGKIYQIPNLDIFIFIFYIITKWDKRGKKRAKSSKGGICPQWGGASGLGTLLGNVNLYINLDSLIISNLKENRKKS
jgi:hypothetical protein